MPGVETQADNRLLVKTIPSSISIVKMSYWGRYTASQDQKERLPSLEPEYNMRGFFFFLLSLKTALCFYHHLKWNTNFNLNIHIFIFKTASPCQIVLLLVLKGAAQKTSYPGLCTCLVFPFFIVLCRRVSHYFIYWILRWNIAVLS